MRPLVDWRRKQLRTAFSIILIAFSAAAASAQATESRVRAEFRTAARALVTASVDRDRVVPVAGAVHPEAATMRDLGRVDDSLLLEHIQLALKRPAERQAALDALVQAQHTPGSSSYHRWLTPEDVGAEFSPSAADIAAVRNYLEGEGFIVNKVPASGMYVDFTATAAQVQRSFHTEIHNLQTAAGELRYSAVVEAQLPQALAPALSGFVSLSNIQPHPMHYIVQPVAPASDPGVRPAFLDGNGQQTMGVQDFYTIYNVRPLLTATTPINGSGQTIALLEQTDINAADVTAFRTQFAVTPATPSLTQYAFTSNCADPGTNADEDEAVLDTEWAGGVAPSAALLYVACKSTTTSGIILAAEAVIDNNLAPIMSLSYGDSETGQRSFAAFMSALWEEAAVQGQTVVVSSGDSGSDAADQNASIASQGISVNVLASTPYNVAAGGTDFQDTYNSAIDGGTSFGPSAYWASSNDTGDLTAKGYIPETTWDGSCASSLINANQEGIGAAPLALCEDSGKNGSYLRPIGAGGGISIFNARPFWQTSTVYGLPSTASAPDRLLPDVSLFASNGIWGHSLYLYQSDHSPALYNAGGTSFVAPQLAGVFALIAQMTNDRLGIAAPQLYSLAGAQFGTTSFTGSACNGSGASGVGETSAAPASSCVFYDIQTGNNSDACTAGTTNCFADSGQPYGLLSTSASAAVPAYSATPGWDYATGIGSLNVANLANAWVNPVAQSPAITLTPTINPVKYGRTSLQVNMVVSGNNPVPPLGSATLVYNGTAEGSFTLTDAGCTGATCSATHTATVPLGGVPPVGYVITLTSAYTPSSPSYYYVASTGSASFTVQKQTPTVTAAAASVSSGTATTAVTASIAYTGTGTVPSGTMSFAIDSGAAVVVACTGEASPLACTANYNTAALASGPHNLTATYSGDSNYASAFGTATITITGVAQTLTWNPSSNRIYAGSALGTGALDATDTVSGSIAYTATKLPSGSPVAVSASTVLSAGSYTLTANFSPTDTTNYTSNSESMAFIVQNQNIFVANSGGTVASLFNTGSAASSATAGGGIGAAIDASGFVWSINANGSRVSRFTDSGTLSTSYTGAGINAAKALAIDGLGTVWIANGDGTLSAFTNTGAAVSSTTIAFSGNLSAPASLSVDSAGSLWIANSGNDTVTEVIGVAAPVVAPTVTAVTNSTLGTQP